MLDAVVENSCVVAGDGVESGFLKLGQGFGNGGSGMMSQGVDLARGESVKPEGREALLDGAEEGVKPCDGGGGG